MVEVFCDQAAVMMDVEIDSCVGGIGLACGDGSLFFGTADGAGDILASAAVREVLSSSSGTGGNSGGIGADGGQGLGTG